jgi:hypothetical protein
MTLLISLSLAAVLLVIFCVCLLLRRFAPGRRELPVTTEWMGELSADRYRPMLRLLDDTDFQFLRSQKGFTPAMAKRLRNQRAEIFRNYMRMLEGDFQRICAALKLVLAHSEVDRPELASTLMQYQVRFAAGIIGANARLLLFRFGVNGIDAAGLVKIFDSMRIELTNMVPSSAAIPA